MRKRHSSILVLSLLLVLLLCFYFSLRFPLFNTPTSTVLEDEKGHLLNARIAMDGQWRFPSSDAIPLKFKTALLTFEDQHFHRHCGVDWGALGKAIIENIKAGKIVRGGSTITMQVIRISRNNPPRTIFQKAIEIILAIRLEWAAGKNEILKLYASEAPFGGNVVGLEAACWRYFGKNPSKLTWAEASLLAVLPNSPALIYPGKNQEKLKQKRNRLLQKLYQKGYFSKEILQLSFAEPIPGKPMPLPTISSHLLDEAEKKGWTGKRIESTISIQLQERVNEVLKQHYYRLVGNEIYNAAALVIEVETGFVKAYTGNIPDQKSEQKGFKVDVIQAPRSTGSILKPLLFSLLLEDGKYLPTSLVPDIPTIIAGYAPKNYFLTYDGAVPLKQAISRSLNVPAVRLLQEYSIEKFHDRLKKMGMTTLNRPANNYGLSLILGGAEGKLWDLANIYRNMAWSLNHQWEISTNKIQGKSCTWVRQGKREYFSQYAFPDPACIYLTFEAMNEVARPEEDQSWKDFASSYKIAWKTGTSFGNRDGWAIGTTPQYVVAVWTGNASGEGRPGLTGIDAAAPIMFDIFRLLKSPYWFSPPLEHMQRLAVCVYSGFKAGNNCESTDTLWVHKKGTNSKTCPYHQNLFLTADQQFQANSQCESLYNLRKTEWFVLPPIMEYFYKPHHPSYKSPPPLRKDCQVTASRTSFDIIYPQQNSKIYIPKELDGKKGKAIFEAASINTEKELFWYIDNQFLGSTKNFHQQSINPTTGSHKLTVINLEGEWKEVGFEVISK